MGGFNLAAAEAVCADGDLIDEFDVVDLVGSLVDKSMIIADRGGETVRYSQLETFRQFGRDCLVEAGELDMWRDAWLGYMVQVVRNAGEFYETDRCVEAVDIFEAEWSNIRAAVQWAQASGRIDTAEELLVAVSWFAYWSLRDEVNVWVTSLLTDPTAGVRSLAVGSLLAASVGDHDKGLARGSEAIELGVGDDPVLGRAYLGVSGSHLYSGRAEPLELTGLAWQAHAERLNDRFALGILCGYWQSVHDLAHRNEQGLLWTSRMDELVTPLANPVTSSYGAFCAGTLLASCNRIDDAERELRTARRWAASGGVAAILSGLHSVEAALWRAKGDHDRYLESMGTAFAEGIEAHNQLNSWVAAQGIAQEWLRRGQHDLSLPVFGYLRAHRLQLATKGRERTTNQIDSIAETSLQARELLTAGAEMTRQEITEFIMNALGALPTTIVAAN